MDGRLNLKFHVLIWQLIFFIMSRKIQFGVNTIGVYRQVRAVCHCKNNSTVETNEKTEKNQSVFAQLQLESVCEVW